MKDKPTKWGFKLYELCESKSGYVYSLEVYCADKRLSNKPVDVTMRLMQPLLDKGHRLYIDNYYCCPELWGRLKGRATMMVGTCRRNRVDMPADLFEGRQRAGDLDYRRKGQLLATRWFDKWEVVNLSSFHLPQLRETQGRFEVKQKPLAVIDYVNFMSGVDHSDQLLSFFPMRRKSQKWLKKPFFHLLTLASIQTNILLNKHRRQHGKRPMNLASVVKDLIVSMVSHIDVEHDADRDNVNCLWHESKNATLFNSAPRRMAPKREEKRPNVNARSALTKQRRLDSSGCSKKINGSRQQLGALLVKLDSALTASRCTTPGWITPASFIISCNFFFTEFCVYSYWIIFVVICAYFIICLER